MNRKMATGLASALLLAGTAAFAGTPADKIQMQTHAMLEKVALHRSAPMAMARDTAHSMLRKAAWKDPAATIGDREVNALNVLEAAGYRTVKSMHPNGRDIVVKAMKAGKDYSLVVSPEGKITRQA